MSSEQVKQIEANIRQAKEFLDMEASLERLLSNKDYKRVFGEGYFKAEAIRLVHLKADPAFHTAERQAAIVLQIDAIGSLSTYLRMISMNASQARKAIEEGEAAIEELAAEELAK